MFIDAFGTVVNSLESHFGHDRAKNDSGIVSPAQAVTANWLHACKGWSSNCVRRRDGGLVCLINLVARNHTDRARGLAFFSITPE